MSKEARKLMYEYRIQLLTARDPVGNAGIINKLRRKIRLIGDNYSIKEG